VFNAIRANEVLALHPDYFRLRKPLERRVYELARKHCGQQSEWKISLEKLLKKSGSQSPMKRFRQMIKELAASDHLPDYSVAIDVDDMVQFRNRESMNSRKDTRQDVGVLSLRAETIDQAREAAPGWDIYNLEQEWRGWITEPPRNPDAAFIGFCRKWHERRGSPN